MKNLAELTYSQPEAQTAARNESDCPSSPRAAPADVWVEICDLQQPIFRDAPVDASQPRVFAGSRSSRKRKRCARAACEEDIPSDLSPQSGSPRARRSLFPEMEAGPIFPVVGDGRCLFRALVRQFSHHFNFARDSHGMALDEADELEEREAADRLRDDVCDYMESNVDELLNASGQQFFG